MRIWHYKLVPLLPRQQLLGQWRECVSIAKAIHENGTPNHILVNRVTDYPINDFYRFCCLVVSTMTKREYRVSAIACKKIKSFLKTSGSHLNGKQNTKPLFKNWHDEIYLRQCLYNLEEKFICNGMSQEEWDVIYNEFKDFTPLTNKR